MQQANQSARQLIGQHHNCNYALLISLIQTVISHALLHNCQNFGYPHETRQRLKVELLLDADKTDRKLS